MSNMFDGYPPTLLRSFMPEEHVRREVANREAARVVILHHLGYHDAQAAIWRTPEGQRGANTPSWQGHTRLMLPNPLPTRDSAMYALAGVMAELVWFDQGNPNLDSEGRPLKGGLKSGLFGALDIWLTHDADISSQTWRELDLDPYGFEEWHIELCEEIYLLLWGKLWQPFYMTARKLIEEARLDVNYWINRRAHHHRAFTPQELAYMQAV